MMFHHIVTVILIGASYTAGYEYVGCVVMLLLDAADPFLHFGKLIVYKRDSYGKLTSSTPLITRFIQKSCGILSDIFFGCFVITFAITRNIMYPYIVWSTIWEGSHYMGDGEHVSRIETAYKLGVPYLLCILLLLAILVLQFIWLRMIINLVYKVLIGIEIKDDRSDSESDTPNKQKSD